MNNILNPSSNTNTFFNRIHVFFIYEYTQKIPQKSLHSGNFSKAINYVDRQVGLPT